MKPEVIGVTTEYASIAKMLGVDNEADYGLYQETRMGKYYARFLPGGTFEEKVVRLISYEQAVELEASAVSLVAETYKKFQECSVWASVIDWERFNNRMEDIQLQTKARAEEMGKQLRGSLERAGFHPVYSNN